MTVIQMFEDLNSSFWVNMLKKDALITTLDLYFF